MSLLILFPVSLVIGEISKHMDAGRAEFSAQRARLKKVNKHINSHIYFFSIVLNQLTS